ncbi:MAG: hypothetical protein KKD18_03390 [Nanoarchaeota archaeon]|nr:hypothetical protein [Nanoarchaeota archaeon]MBU0977434.1 hypothetical protein [Nanoarchaeota archaeon]
MTTVKRLREMEKNVLSLAECAGDRGLAVIGGHFPLEKDYRAGVRMDDTFGIFPQYTFDLACRAVRGAKGEGREAGLVLLVDDHVLMTPRDWYAQSRRDDLQAQEVRKKVGAFFSGFEIPEEYTGIMAQRGVGEGDIIRAQPEMMPFQESKYREEFEAQNPGVPIGCAGEYELILRDLARRGYQKIIGIIPQRCLGPTCSAVTNYGLKRKQAGGIPKIEVVHFYLPTDSEIDSVEGLDKAVKGMIEVRRQHERL